MTSVHHLIRVLWLSSLLLSGCAFDLAHVNYTPVDYQPRIDSGRSFILTDEVHIKDTPCGYSRTLGKSTTWEFFGTIPEGEVFRSKDQALTVECSNVFEAYLVISENRLIGFYLPVEKGFVSIKDPLLFPITWKKEE